MVGCFSAGIWLFKRYPVGGKDDTNLSCFTFHDKGGDVFF